MAASEPPAPGDISSADELFLTGQYLEQHRHATRSPEPYWQEALRRDPDDSRAHIALARQLTARGLFAEAERHLRSAVARLTARVPNPADGEPHYRLGIVLTNLGHTVEAIERLGKSQWNSPWRVPAGFALARLHAEAGRYDLSERALDDVLSIDSQHSQARALLVLVLRAVGRAEEGSKILSALLTDDPLDQWARDIAGQPMTSDAPTLLDVALEYATTGFRGEALRVLNDAVTASDQRPICQVQIAPLAHYHAAVLHARAGRPGDAATARASARCADAAHCLPSRLADVIALETAGQEDTTAALLLGSWYYDKRRYEDAIRAWTTAAETGDPHRRAAAHRNLGIAAHNWSRDSAAAIELFERARAAVPGDAKILFEYDQLTARAGDTDRLPLLEANRALVAERDDLTAEFAQLLVSAGRPLL